MSNNEHLDGTMKRAMAKIIENLGPNVKQARYEIYNFIDTYVSILYYLSVIFKNGTNDQSEELSLILKKSKPTKMMQKFYCSDSRFYNEILFYKMYIQSNNDNFPKCFYADYRPPTGSVIVLENVVKRGFCICPYEYDAPSEYTSAAMREIGRLHGKGYAMREQQREKFFDIVKDIKDPRYITNKKEWIKLLNTTAPKTVKYLRSRGYDATFCDKMEAFLSNVFENVIMKAIVPCEPSSTLCHGDYVLSNVFFKAQNDGQYRALLIDFTDVRYATPAIDISTYLCACCPNELKKEKFFDIFKVYHNALKEYLLESGVGNVERYSYDVLLNEFKKHGLYGFIIATYYSSSLRGYLTNIDKADETEYIKIINQSNGDEMCKILADTLLNLKDIGCLEHI